MTLAKPTKTGINWGSVLEGGVIRGVLALAGSWAFGVLGVGGSYWKRWLVAVVILWALEVTVIRALETGLWNVVNAHEEDPDNLRPRR